MCASETLLVLSIHSLNSALPLVVGRLQSHASHRWKPRSSLKKPRLPPAATTESARRPRVGIGNLPVLRLTTQGGSLSWVISGR